MCQEFSLTKGQDRDKLSIALRCGGFGCRHSHLLLHEGNLAVAASLPSAAWCQLRAREPAELAAWREDGHGFLLGRGWQREAGGRKQN